MDTKALEEKACANLLTKCRKLVTSIRASQNLMDELKKRKSDVHQEWKADEEVNSDDDHLFKRFVAVLLFLVAILHLVGAGLHAMVFYVYDAATFTRNARACDLRSPMPRIKRQETRRQVLKIGRMHSLCIFWSHLWKRAALCDNTHCVVPCMASSSASENCTDWSMLELTSE